MTHCPQIFGFGWWQGGSGVKKHGGYNMIFCNKLLLVQKVHFFWVFDMPQSPTTAFLVPDLDSWKVKPVLLAVPVIPFHYITQKDMVWLFQLDPGRGWTHCVPQLIWESTQNQNIRGDSRPWPLSSFRKDWVGAGSCHITQRKIVLECLPTSEKSDFKFRT